MNWLGSIGIRTGEDSFGDKTNMDATSQPASSYNASQAASPYNASQAASPYNASQAASPYNASQAASPYNASQAASPYNASQAASPYNASQAASSYNASQAASSYIGNPWSNYESDKSGDSPSGTEIDASRSLNNGGYGGMTSIKNNGGGAGGIGWYGDLPRQKLNICNSFRSADYGKVYDSNGNFVKKYTLSEISEACKNTVQYNCGGQYCQQSYSDKGLEKIEETPPVETDTTLTGQKGGDECVYTEDQIKQIKYDLAKAEEELLRVESKIVSKGRECTKILWEEKVKNENNSDINLVKKCGSISRKENTANKKLKNLQKGTVSYSKQLDYIYELRNEVKACFRKNKIKTEYKRMFITQMYDSNEYEGDISVFDKNWNKGDELIHDCDD